MRCNNCGWENPDSNTRCEKCNSPLSGGVSNQSAYQQPVQQHSFSKTVNEAAVFPEVHVNGSNVCPQCGYPMRPGVSICPNCHYGATEREPQVQPVPTPSPAPKQVHARPGLGTVNPWIKVGPTSKCVLEPIAQEGVESPATLHLKGDSNELSRANLDPENQTITSKVQAIMTCEDGQWFIVDKSAQHTTFIYAANKTALKDGDIILMGNRQFIFHAE